MLPPVPHRRASDRLPPSRPVTLDWGTIFDNFGVKRVTRTDKGKGAYVVSEAQKEALLAAGHSPSETEDRTIIGIDILFDPDVQSVTASYYNSLREGSGRTPETRMGLGIIHWAAIGDELIIGNCGNRVMAARVGAAAVDAADVGRTLARRGIRKRILARAAQASGAPPRRIRTVQDFVRDPYVVAAALIRAAGACEMPSCSHAVFHRDDGTVFLEVHHVTPLAEGGDDSLINAVALCPACHRELHFGRTRMRKRATLAVHIRAKPLR